MNLYSTFTGTANEPVAIALTGTLPELPAMDGHEADVLGTFSTFVSQFVAALGPMPADHSLHIRANAKRTRVYARYVKNVVQGTSNKAANKVAGTPARQNTAQARKAAQESAQGGTLHDAQGRAVTLPSDFIPGSAGVLAYITRKAAIVGEGDTAEEAAYITRQSKKIAAQLKVLQAAEAAMSKAIAARDVALADCVAVLAPSRVQSVAPPVADASVTAAA